MRKSYEEEGFRMFCYASDAFQMGIDCLAPLDRDNWFLCGWVTAPRGAELQLTPAGRTGTPLPVLARAHHPRPDLPPPADASGSELRGFHLVFAAPGEAAAALTLRAQAGGLTLSARLGDPAVARDLARALAGRDGRLNMRLLRDAAEAEALAEGLMTHGARTYGALADWIAVLPAPGTHCWTFGPLAEIRAARTEAGDLGLALRAENPLTRINPEAFLLQAIARCDAGQGAPPRLLPARALHWHMEAAGPALLAWTRLDPELVPTLSGCDLLIEGWVEGRLIQARFEPERLGLARCFDLLAASALGTAPEAEHRLALRRAMETLLAARARALLPEIARRIRPAPRVPGPPLLLVSGVEDEWSTRLLSALGTRLAAEAQPILLFGPEAAEAVRALEAHGVEALAGEAAQRALAAGAPGNAMAALSVAELAQAVITERLPAALDGAAGATRLGSARAWHHVAGLGTDAGESLAALRHPGTAGLGPGSWSCPEAAPFVEAHVEELQAAASLAGLVGGRADG